VIGSTIPKSVLGITKGLKVLDLGCGDGTTALPEARLGADVLGVDIAKNLVEAVICDWANQRSPWSISCGLMSALGQKQTFAPQKVMSALPPKVDMRGCNWNVRFVPIADIHG
jgi:2-polyprenyl-3-methyl-5-hydroxy-6-metoxy-1,4-benzoquinol methylase